MLGSEDAVDLVIGAHHRPGLRLLDGLLEGGQVDFAERAFVHLGADAEALKFLVVGGVMLERGAHAFRLHAPDEVDRQLAGQVGILGEVFEVAPPQRRALHVDARTQHDIHMQGDGFLASAAPSSPISATSQVDAPTPLVHNVIWPAVAGSVLWTFLQVAIDPNITGPRCPRLFALLLVGVYLAIDWVNTHQIEEKINENYWRYDMPLAASLASFAVATQFDARWATWPLAVAFVVAIIGHCFGAWDLAANVSSRKAKARATLAGFNALGLLVLLLGMCVEGPWALWLTPIAVLSVVVLYLSFREKISTW